MKYFAPIAGVFFLSLIGLMFYWLQWDEESQRQIKQAEQQLVTLQSFWNKQSTIRNGSVRIGYEDIAASGFPFGMRVRLLKPYVSDNHGAATFTLTMNYADLLPSGEEGSEYRIEYPRNGHAILQSGGTKKHYYLSLSALPQLWAHKVSVAGREPSAVNEYGMQAPENLLLMVEQGGQLRRFPLRFISTEEPIWRPLFRDLREKLARFEQVLERS